MADSQRSELAMEPLTINSSRGAYTVNFVPEIETLVQILASIENTFLVLDSTVASLYGVHLKRLLEAKPYVIVVPTEEEKSLAGCETILAGLVAQNADRNTKVIAIGGGIIQDLATMCAHIYFRGISWIFVPTTLLAMADSCIGAKASINFRGYKNQLGVFHSPGQIYISPEFLITVTEDELRSGYGEIFKLHFAGSPEKFFRLAKLVENESWRTPSLGKIIHTSLEIKKAYIEGDEFDTGIRRHLNYGHTFGHALESVTSHRVPHGLAISWGMDLINE
jgi:3-dehydroquinate synthase